MYYKAKRVDTDKALQAISDSRRYQERAVCLEIEKKRAFLEGINKGLDIAEELFTCSNYEDPSAATYEEGIRDAIYYIAKELDVQSQDIRESGNQSQQMCVNFAERIRARFEEDQLYLPEQTKENQNETGKSTAESR